MRARLVGLGVAACVSELRGARLFDDAEHLEQVPAKVRRVARCGASPASTSRWAAAVSSSVSSSLWRCAYEGVGEHLATLGHALAGMRLRGVHDLAERRDRAPRVVAGLLGAGWLRDDGHAPATRTREARCRRRSALVRLVSDSRRGCSARGSRHQARAMSAARACRDRPRPLQCLGTSLPRPSGQSVVLAQVRRRAQRRCGRCVRSHRPVSRMALSERVAADRSGPARA